MTGMQKQAYDAVNALAIQIREGRYGSNDVIDLEALNDDVVELEEKLACLGLDGE